MRAAGILLVASGLGLLASQLVRLYPWQLGIVLGILAVGFGVGLLDGARFQRRSVKASEELQAPLGADAEGPYLYGPGARLP